MGRISCMSRINRIGRMGKIKRGWVEWLGWVGSAGWAGSVLILPCLLAKLPLHRQFLRMLSIEATSGSVTSRGAL